MDSQGIIDVAFALIGALGGFILKSIHSDIKALTSKIQEIEVLVAGEYVKRDSFDAMTSKLFDKLDKIDAKLDLKADKANCPAPVHQ